MPFIATLLIVLFGGVNAPAWLLIVSSLIMIPIIMSMPETRYRDV